MGCLTATQRATIEAQIVKIDALIAAGEDALLEAIGNSEVEEYRFDSGDGSQRTRRRNPNQINQLIDDLTARRNRLQRKLDGTMNVTLAFRRRGYCYR